MTEPPDEERRLGPSASPVANVAMEMLSCKWCYRSTREAYIL